MSDGQDEPNRFRTEMPLSNAFHDIVAALATKLDETSKSDMRERHAHAVGKHDIAAMFARIAARDRHSIDELMQSVSAHEPEERAAPERRYPPRFGRE